MQVCQVIRYLLAISLSSQDDLPQKMAARKKRTSLKGVWIVLVLSLARTSVCLPQVLTLQVLLCHSVPYAGEQLFLGSRADPASSSPFQQGHNLHGTDAPTSSTRAMLK